MVAPTSTMVPSSMSGQEGVLLRLVEAVDLVDEEQGAAAVLAAEAGGLEDLLQVGDAGEDGADLHEGEVGGVGEEARDGGLADAGRAPEDDGAEVALGEHPAERGVGAEEVVLADDLLEPARAEAVGERARGLVRGRRRGRRDGGRRGRPWRDWPAEGRRKRFARARFNGLQGALRLECGWKVAGSGLPLFTSVNRRGRSRGSRGRGGGCRRGWRRRVKAARTSARMAARSSAVPPFSRRTRGRAPMLPTSSITASRPPGLGRPRSIVSARASARPAASRRPVTRAASRKAIGPGASGGVGATGPRRATAARCGMANQGLCSGPAQATKTSRPSGAQGAGDVAEGGDRVGEEHHAEARGGEVEAAGREGMVLGVAPGEADVAEGEVAAALLGAREERLGEVEAEDAARRRRRPRRARGWSRRRRSRCRARARRAGRRRPRAAGR